MSNMVEAHLARKGWNLLHSFLETKKVLWFEKRCSDFVHLWVKFPIQNAALWVSRKNISEIFACEVSLSRVVDEMCLSKCLYSKKPPLHQKISACTVEPRLLTHLVSCFVRGIRIIVNRSSNSPFVYGNSFVWITGFW